jgi:hypothetical protein
VQQYKVACSTDKTHTAQEFESTTKTKTETTMTTAMVMKTTIFIARN